MLKRKRVGFIIWGAIIVLIGIGAFTQNIDIGTSLGWLCILVGVVFLVLGIVNCIRTSIYNNNLIQTRGRDLKGECPFCNKEISIPRKTFQRHRNYPEGYADCPICRKHLSIKVFEPDM